MTITLTIEELTDDPILARQFRDKQRQISRVVEAIIEREVELNVPIPQKDTVIIRNCVTCGKVMNLNQYQINSKKKYCSGPCKTLTAKSNEVRKCLHCNRLIGGKKTKKYCGLTCIQEYRAKKN